MTLPPETYPSESIAQQPAASPPFAAGPRPRLRQQSGFLREILETALLIVAIYTFVNLATARFVVEGHSMLPNFTTDQFIIVSRLSYLVGEPQRGDVVVFHYPMESDRDFIKRVIGLPGETVTILEGRVYIDGKLLDEPYIENFCRGKSCDGEWVIGPDEYFVLGDNRGASKDSQDFGPVGEEYIVGRAFVRYWPPSDWGIVQHPRYDLSAAPPLPTSTPTPPPTPEGTPSATDGAIWPGGYY